MTSVDSEYKMVSSDPADNIELDISTDPVVSAVDVQLKTPDDSKDVQASNCSSDAYEKSDDINKNVSDDDDVNSITLCAICLNSCDTKTEECFEKDDCDHLLCVKCRFMQDNACKLCEKTSEKISDPAATLDLSKGLLQNINDLCQRNRKEIEASGALNLSMNFLQNLNDLCKRNPKILNGHIPLDLSTGWVQNIADLYNYFNKELSSNNTASKKKSTKIKRYVVPSYIELLPCNQHNETGYRCSICKKVFYYRLQARYHEACFTGNRPLKCDKCDNTFIKKSHLDYHLKSHSGIKPFKCDICGKGFIQRSKLTRHMTIHSDAKTPFKCEICDLTFSAKQALEHHFRTHTGERPFNCKHCRRKFSTKGSLKKHESRHSGARNFVCEQCGKRFMLKQNLTSHRRWHSDARPHSCSKCGRAFVERKDLTRHMQIHTDTERDYECSICIMAFRRKDNLERHMKNIHPETITKYGRPEHIVSVVKVNNNIQLDPDNRKVSVKETKESDCEITVPDSQKMSDNVKLKKKAVGKKLKDVIKRRNDLKTVSENDSSSSKSSENKTKCSDLNQEDIITNPVLNNDLVGGNLNSAGSNENICDDENTYEDLTHASSEINQRTVADNTKSDPMKTTAPKCQKVSVISSTKAYLNDINRTPTPKSIHSNGSSNKKTESIAPYRLITPPTNPLDSSGGNCVPTITKVTHIVHTSNTGISNVKTLITTRNVSDKAAKKLKQKKLSVDSQQSAIESESKPSDKQQVNSVIKYVSRNNHKDSAEMKYKCYRVLKNNNNQSFTLSSSNICSNNMIHDNGTSMIQSLNVPDDSTLPESVDSIQNLTYNNDGGYNNSYQPNLNIIGISTVDNSKIDMLNDCCNVNIVDNNIYDNSVESTFNRLQDQSENIYSVNKIYNVVNMNKNLPTYSNISDSCLLADNTLDDSITASLYMDDETSTQMNGVYEAPPQHNFIDNRSMLDQVCVPNYSGDITGDFYVNHNGKQMISDVRDEIRYNCLNVGNIIEKVNISNDTVSRDPYIENNLIDDPSCYNFNTTSNYNECGTHNHTSVESIDFKIPSSVHLHSFTNNSDGKLFTISPPDDSPQRKSSENNLFTLANMACARANVQHPV